MQVSVEKTSELSRKMTVSIPENVVQEKMDERLQSLAKDIRIDGFRPGKAPKHIIKKIYGERVRVEITNDLIQSSYFEALQSQALTPAGHPYIDSLDGSEGFKYTAVFEVYPEINLDSVKNLNLTRKVATVEEHDIDGMIEKLRLQQKTWHEVARPAQTGDQVTVHFSGWSEGENFTDGKVENYPVAIGGKQMIPGFEDSLIGLAAGGQKTFTITFPEEYGNTKLAGKEAQFEVEAVKVAEPLLPEIDAEFIKGYGIEAGTLEAFRDDVKANMERELANALHSKFKTSVMDALYEAVTVTVPNTLVDQEVEQMMKPYIENAKRQKIKLADLKLPRDIFEEQARRRVALGLILGEIIAAQNIKLDDGKVRAAIEDMAVGYEKPEDVIEWYYADKKRLQDVQQLVIEDQAVAWLAAQATVTDEQTTFAAIMDKQEP